MHRIGERVGCPVHWWFVVSFGCRVIEEFGTGDHRIFVAEGIAAMGYLPREHYHGHVTKRLYNRCPLNTMD